MVVVDEFGREIPMVAEHAALPTPRHGRSSSWSRPSNSETTSYRTGGQRSAARGGQRSAREYGGARRVSSPRHHGTNSRTAVMSPSSGAATARRPGNHISTQYVDEPLLCRFVWKEKQKQEKEAEQTNEKSNNDDQDDDNNDKDRSKQEEEATTSTAEAVPPETTATTANDDSPSKDAVAKEADDPYSAYRRKYCLVFIRAFFNNHLDDSWFRALYSPAARQKWLQLEHGRSVQEARGFLQAIQTDAVNVVTGARLGGGQKTHQAVAATATSSVVPTTHLFSWQQPDSPKAAMCVSQIPCSVTNEQLVIALLDHCSPDDSNNNNKALDLTVYSSTTVPVQGSRHEVLLRHAIVVGQRKTVQTILKALSSNSNSSAGAVSPPKQQQSAHETVPRRKDAMEEESSSWHVLTADCTDPYGRLQYDADGRGKAPADGLAVPPQKARVWVQALMGATTTTTTGTTATVASSSSCSTSTSVLSAAVSVTGRLASDAQHAVRMATRLDAVRHIPSDCGWLAIHEALFGSSSSSSTTTTTTTPPNDGDLLDVGIAYLRRIHLVSFYHGCDQPAVGIAQVLSGKHAASTIRLRLANADELLQEAATTTAAVASNVEDAASNDDAPVVKDMLVQRLDESIEKALANFEAWGNNDSNDNNPYRLSHEQERQAAEIQTAEQEVRDQWLRDHSVIDNDDGRARCSFHFCHKLFKDTSFLHKHLLKKHVEYLSAEQAKCHDAYMMKAWDAAVDRRVPDVLVDCGSRFGFVAAAVTGQIPDCLDPEPELWRREEERRQRQMQARREEVRHQPRDFHPAPPPPPPYAQVHSALSEPRTSSNFVDVDDMQVEKVQVSFDNVAVPVATKKKKKRKLL